MAGPGQDQGQSRFGGIYRSGTSFPMASDGLDLLHRVKGVHVGSISESQLGYLDSNNESSKVSFSFERVWDKVADQMITRVVGDGALLGLRK